MENFKGDTVLITGAAMGLGLAVAEKFANLGANLSLVDYNADALEIVARELSEKFSALELLTIAADVSKEGDVSEYVDQTLHRFGRIDGFYNNAGIEGNLAPLAEYDSDVFKRVINTNLMGVFYGLQYVIPVMQKQQYGRIVNASSVGGIRGVLHHTPYVASKHAVAGMTKNAALEYGKEGIVVNAIAPGAILTPMVAEAFHQMNPEDPKQAEIEFAQNNPTRRLGVAEEVAHVVEFLLSPNCSYLNGQVIAIDGGQSNAYGAV